MTLGTTATVKYEARYFDARLIQLHGLAPRTEPLQFSIFIRAICGKLYREPELDITGSLGYQAQTLVDHV
jgi:hypothetical protein